MPRDAAAALAVAFLAPTAEAQQQQQQEARRSLTRFLAPQLGQTTMFVSVVDMA